MKDTEKYQFRSTSLFSQLFSASHFHQSSSLYSLLFLISTLLYFSKLKNYKRLITLYPTVQLLKFLKVIAVDKYIYKHIESDDIDIIFYFSISLFQLQHRESVWTEIWKTWPRRVPQPAYQISMGVQLNVPLKSRRV